jgi:antitoxin HicB
MNEYAFVVAPLTEEDGGGYVAVFPDLPGCMSDGDTPQEAVENAMDALAGWMEVQQERGVEIPQPGAAADRVTNKIKSLLDALKNVIEYADAADGHIELLEQTLERTIADLDSDWRKTGVLVAHSAKARRYLAIH